MKKLFISAAALLVGTVSMSALAEVNLTVTVNKTKDKTVFEDLQKFKTANIVVNGFFPVEGAAEAEALANVDNVGNSVTTGPADDVASQKSASIDDPDTGSINDNAGIIGVNQDVGNMVKQGNIVSISVTDTATSFVESQAGVDQLNSGNSSTQEETALLDDTSNRSTSIVNSINNNAGVVGVNQNAGNMNDQTNAVALAVGIGDYFALSEAELGQENTGNVVVESFTRATGTITDSINGNSGIVGVNQATGHMNNQASAVSLAATTSSATVPTLP